MRLEHSTGFDADADPEKAVLPLRHAGVTCASCHVRGWQRYGPPVKSTGAIGHPDTAVHGGFTATSDFKQSAFCASCHQFPQSMAIHGKPLENTLMEWKQSDFSKKNITCQQCHMPDRRHEFRGIHDPVMVRKGLAFQLKQQGDSVVLKMTSKWIGHAFPTYVTPKVIVHAEALGADGQHLRTWQWEIMRAVAYDNGWKELRDTRLMPGETRDFTASPLPAATHDVRYRVSVIPDYFYKGVYQGLLTGEPSTLAQAHIQRAASRADDNDYTLFERFFMLSK